MNADKQFSFLVAFICVNLRSSAAAQVFSSATISAAISRARSNSPGLRLMAPTRAWPPPPYRSQMVARLCFGSSGVQGFEPTEIFVRKLEGLTDTVYVDVGNSRYGMNL